MIAASPATVFSFFADLERWTSWQGVDGEVDLQPGGVFRVRMPGDQVASGRVVEVVPDSGSCSPGAGRARIACASGHDDRRHRVGA